MNTSNANRHIRRRVCAIRLSCCMALLAVAACSRGAATAPAVTDANARRVANLHAFARLYGVVRWFHPSDAAAAVDWDRWLLDGAHRVVDAADQRALRATLTDLFAPIAPTMHIVGAGEQPPDVPALHPASTAGLRVVAWQHQGFGDSNIATGYVSKRRHREKTIAVRGLSYVSLYQSVDAVPYRERRIRLHGKLRTANRGAGRLWLRVDRGDARGFSDNMIRRPVTSESWTDAEIVGTVDGDATKIFFGEQMSGAGTAWYDDLQLAVQASDGTWNPIEISDPGFEASDPLKSWRPGTGRSAFAEQIDSWNVTVDRDRPASGSSSLRIEAATRVVTDELFEQMPAPGETVAIDLGSGLRAHVPIALYSTDRRTIGDDPDLARRARTAAALNPAAGFDAVSGAADVIMFWNVFEHFWPYWNTVSVDWTAALDTALADSLDDHSMDDHVATLERLTAVSPDAHVAITCPGESERGYPPFAVDLVEDQLVVTASAKSAIQRGDVVVSIDGVPAMQLLSTERAQVSGSPQWQVVRALQRVDRGPIGSTLALRVRRHDAELAMSAARIDRRVSENPSHAAIERLDDGIYYVDLSRAALSDINAAIDPIAAAPAVVIDVRDYPRGNHEIISHLLTHLDALRGWELIPLVIRPDSASAPAAWEDTSTWNMPLLYVMQPHIRGRVAFLTGPRAVSYAESVMAIVEHYRLGEIVGAPTAGTNGDIAQILFPSGCTTNFTGRRVIKPDGSQHHLLGVRPTIPASRTIAGVAAGRDEVLDRALAHLRNAFR